MKKTELFTSFTFIVIKLYVLKLKVKEWSNLDFIWKWRETGMDLTMLYLFSLTFSKLNIHYAKQYFSKFSNSIHWY